MFLLPGSDISSCEVPTSPCMSSPCENEGHCISEGQGHDYTCYCKVSLTLVHVRYQLAHVWLLPVRMMATVYLRVKVMTIPATVR